MYKALNATPSRTVVNYSSAALSPPEGLKLKGPSVGKEAEFSHTIWSTTWHPTSQVSLTLPTKLTTQIPRDSAGEHTYDISEHVSNGQIVGSKPVSTTRRGKAWSLPAVECYAAMSMSNADEPPAHDGERGKDRILHVPCAQSSKVSHTNLWCESEDSVPFRGRRAH